MWDDVPLRNVLRIWDLWQYITCWYGRRRNSSVFITSWKFCRANLWDRFCSSWQAWVSANVLEHIRRGKLNFQENNCLGPFIHELSFYSWTIPLIMNYPFNHELSLQSWTIPFFMKYPFNHELSLLSWTIPSIMNYYFNHELSLQPWTIPLFMNYPFNHELSFLLLTIILIINYPYIHELSFY